MRRVMCVCTLAVACCLAVPATEWQYSTPEAEGISSAAISTWLDACERELDAMHGFVLVRHGKIVAEGWWSPYSANRTHMLYSHSKSFTSTAIGFLADEGKLDLDELVADIFPDKAPKNRSDKLQDLRIRDLLTMTTGMPYTDAENKDCGGDWVKLFLENEIKDTPGTRYRYDSCATHVLAAIAERKSGMKLLDYLDKKLFKPVGITGAWTTESPTEIACGGWGMNFKTRDLARFGLLYLNDGVWEGKQILSKNWVRLATSYQTSTQRTGDGDWNQGYGFQFWRCRHNCFRADGAFGQYTIVMPEQDVVLSLNAGLGPMEHELDLVWQYLLPAMKPTALPENIAEAQALKTRCQKLCLPMIKGKEKGTCATQFGKTFDLYDGKGGRFDWKRVRLDECDDGWQLVVTDNIGEKCFPIGYNKWREGEVGCLENLKYEVLGGLVGKQPAAGSGAWVTDNEFRARVYLNNTVFHFDFTLKFKDGGVTFEYNLFGFGASHSVWQGKCTPDTFAFVEKVVQGEPAKPVSITTNKAGNVVVDFGKHQFGWLEVDAIKTGDYTFIWGEMLDANGGVQTNRFYTIDQGTLRCACTQGSFDKVGKVRIPYVRGNNSCLNWGDVGKFGLIMPFRWLEVVKAPFAITADNVRQMPIYYPYNMSEEAFACDQADLVKVHDFCKHTIRATTYTGKFIDGDRERLPYEADSFITLLSTHAITSDDTLARAMADYLATHTTWPTEWKQFMISIFYTDWMRSGKTDLIAKNYALLKDVKSWRHLRRDDGLLVTRGPKVVAAADGEKPEDIVDWGMCYRDGFVFCDVNVVVNALHYRNLLELAAMAKALGKFADATQFEREAAQTFNAFQKVFWDNAQGRFRDGEGTNHTTVQGNAMALACGLAQSPEQRTKVGAYVAEKGFSCSTYMAQFVLDALFEAGRANDAYRLMLGKGERSWLGMMSKGATVTMEFWDLTLAEPGRVPDMNHAWSTAPLNIISRYALGVTPREAGCASVWVRPQPGPLKHLQGAVPTVKGAVSVELTCKEKMWQVKLCAPMPVGFQFLNDKRELPAGEYCFEVVCE